MVLQMFETDLAQGRRGVLEAELGRWQVPGLSLALVADGEVRWTAGIGVRTAGDPAPVTERTLFQHGSCVKAYTALLACVLASESVLDLDAPVRRWVPELELPDADRAASVTLRDLLAHRSGISRHDLVWILSPSLDRVELVRRLRHLPLAAGLRERMEYTNLGYALAALALERAAGAGWGDL
ncbi:MAG: beta-lactamase family protein, partial [Actinobacteria bacterium]|nr:beta-lactamase family protein [Actinomycetota bacterium]